MKTELDSSKLKNNIYKTILFFSVVALSSSCISIKNWKEDQYLLAEQRIEGNNETDYYDLEALFQQKDNRKIGLFVQNYPYVWLYEMGENAYKTELEYDSLILHYQQKGREGKARRLQKQKDKRYTTKKWDEKIEKNLGNLDKIIKLRKKKNKQKEKIEEYRTEGNWMMRSVGDPPVFYDSLLTEKTRREMILYLHTQGFFQGEVEIQKEYKKRQKVVVTYLISENEPTIINDVTYYGDTTILNLVDTEESLLQELTRYIRNNLDGERTRIHQLLRNNGYYNFNRQYVRFNVDTNLVDFAREENPRKLANIQVFIEDPFDEQNDSLLLKHQEFFYDHTQVFVVEEDDTVTVRNKVHENIHFRYSKRRYYSPRVLGHRIKFRPFDLYGFDKTLNTQKSLLDLNMFRFVNITFTEDDNRLLTNIYASPLDKYQFSVEAGLNVGVGLPGPFVNFSFLNRNTFGGAEIFETNLQFLVDGQASFSQNNQTYSSIETIFSTSLTFPQLILPTRLRFQFFDFNPTTTVKAGLNFARRPEYIRTAINASISYRGYKRFSTYNLTLLEANIVNTLRVDSTFRAQLNLNPALRASFGQALVTSTYATYTYNNATGEGVENPQYFRVLLESGGTNLDLLNNVVGRDDQIFGLNYFQFVKTSASYHYTWKVTPIHSLAFRVFGGYALPYGRANTLPYEKFFFSGGSNSNRAWLGRRLGPGSFSRRNADGTINYDIEQPGEIIMEANIEYRFPMIGFIEGALYADAGNVWTREIERDENGEPLRPGADFSFDRFYREIALGSGLGLRFDFSFLVLRFDTGIKIYDPGRDEGRKWAIADFDWGAPFRNNQILVNIGIGYPF